MSSMFNQSCLRSRGSALSVTSTDEEHAIAHEALLIAILVEIANHSASNQTLNNIFGQAASALTGKPKSTKIVQDLITEAQQKSRHNAT